jgi:cobyrinic acid a,c-diamide synthase
MYLSRGIETLDGTRHELVGLLPAWTRMLDRLKSLGYVETTVVEDSLFGLEGAQLRGHEFHYSELLNDPTEDPLWRPVYATRRRRSEEVIPEGFQSGRILVSYVHMHFASRPEAVRRFAGLCGRIAGKS